MKKEDFITYYPKLTNIELLKIIQEKEKYRSDAIEAATEILSARTYSEDEHTMATAELNFDLTRRQNKKKGQKN